MSTEIEPHKPKHPAYRVWGSVDPIEREQRLQAVIQRFVDEEKLADIAKDIGLSHSALCMALLEYAEDDWKRAQVARAIAELEKATETREAADSMLNLARARDAEKTAQWKLERLCRRLFGQDAPPSSAQAVQINITLGSAPESAKPLIIDGGPTD